jgi:hypothetical protein
MIAARIFTEYMLKAVDSVYRDLKPTLAQRTRLRQRIERASTPNERVCIFRDWVNEVRKAQVTP